MARQGIYFGLSIPPIRTKSLPDGKHRRPYVVSAVHSYSQKAYSEAVWRQTIEVFLQCVKYAKNNALNGCTFHSLMEEPQKAAFANPDLPA